MVKEATGKEVLTYLKGDVIGRNSQLNTLMKFICSLKEPTVIGVDSAWGSGKTVFVKQLQLVSNRETKLNEICGVDRGVAEQFRDDCNVYYFNAWEYDFMPSPLHALALSIATCFGSADKLKRFLGKIPKMISMNGLLEKYLNGAIDLDNTNDAVDAALGVKKMKDDVETFIEALKGKTSGKKLVFVVDEIDRCKPAFAVDLLEVIKHYFQIDGVVFVVATNNDALSSVIKHYYGRDYDGGAYLERFFDITTFLKRPNTKSYMKLVGDNHQWQYVDADIIDCFGLSMREIRHFYMLERMTNGFVSSSGCDSKDEKVIFAKYVALPIILAMIVVGDERLTAVMAGRGADAIYSVVEQSPACKFRISNMPSIKDVPNVMENKVKELYESLFGDNEIADHFREALGILSSFTEVDEIAIGGDDK